MKIIEIMSKVRQSLKGNKKTKKFIPNLTATPNHVCFKNYEEGNVYKEQIQIFNQDLKTYHLAIKFDSPDDLKLSIIGSVSKTRIDSGEDILLEVEFRPTTSFRKESVDRRYEVCLNIVNANSKFFIPILILSQNPVINFPKEISLPATAVNTPAYTNIFVLNYSNQIQKFSFDCRSEIKIIPDCKSIGLKPSDGSTFLIEFVPKSVGSFREKIHVCFDGEKKFAIVIKCNVIPVNIFLNEDTVEFSPTFIGMSESKEIHIINNSDEATYFEWVCLDQGRQEKDQIFDSSRYLDIIPKAGELQPNTITAVNITFNPEDTEEDDFEILKEVFFSFGLKLSAEFAYQPQINVRGKIVGPSFQLDYKHVDIGELYLGESRYIDINISNTGIINGKIFFQKSPSSFDGIVKISSRCEIMSPGEMKTFKIKYLARKAGKFYEQAFFKVKNGERLSLVIQGIIKPLEIQIDPHLINFNDVPMCVPQMQFLMMRNELPFDIDVRLEVENTGDENPLEFLEFFNSGNSKSDNSSESGTSSVLRSGSQTSNESCSSLLARSSIKHFMDRTGKLENLRDSVAAAEDGIAKIYKRVDDYLENCEIVQTIIKAIFDGKVKDELEKLFIIGTIVDLMIENMKEAELKNLPLFNEKNWEISENPREIEINVMTFTLPAQSTESSNAKVFLTPNFIGKFTKTLKVKLLMSKTSSCAKQSVDETIINIPMTYDCQPPELIVKNRMHSISGYAESEIPLDILIENIGTVDGFFSFTTFEDTEMEVKCVVGKFFIAKNSKKIVNLIVTPLKSGLILKYVNLVILGSNRKVPLSIECKSLAPDIVIKPNKIFENDLKVLSVNDSRIFIENRSTAKARFFIKLEHENKAFDVNPRGGILSSKQTVLITLSKFFYDPGDYKDILVVEVVNSKVIKIPIKCTAQGLPILIEPSMTRPVDFGTLFISKTPYFLEFNFTNGGMNTYVIFVILKNWKNKSETRFLAEPNRFELLPNATRVVKFYLNAETDSNPDEEFTVEGCSVTFPVRELILESKLRANIIRPTLSFFQDELVFDCFYNAQHFELTKSIKIMNKSNLPLPIALKVEGNFYLVAETPEQKVKFEMKVKETKEIFVSFNRSLIGDSNEAQSFSGKIKAYSLGKLQSTINLQANMIYPTVEISNRQLNFINNILPCAFGFKITNNGQVDSTFNLNFHDKSTTITKIQERRQENLLNIAQCLMKQKCDLRETFFKPDSVEMLADSIMNEDNDDFLVDYAVSELHELSEINVKEVDTKKNRRKSKTRGDETQSKEKGKTASDRDAAEDLDINAFLKKNYDLEVTPGDIIKYFKHLTKSLSEVLFNEEKSEKKMNKVNVQKGDEGNSLGKYLKLSQINGTLRPNESRDISVFFNGGSEAFHLSTILRCDILGGATSEINIKISNCNPNLLITKTFFELSNEPWSEISFKNICVSNISPANNQIKLITDNSKDEKFASINGGVKICCKTEPCFVLDEQRNFCANIKFSIFKGCAFQFKNEFGIQVNAKPPIPISFAGLNKFQTATLLNFEQKSLMTIEKTFEYTALQKMFRFVDKIRVPDEDVKFEDILKIKMQIKPERESGEAPEARNRKKNPKKEKKLSDNQLMKSQVENLAGGDGQLLLRVLDLCYDQNGKVVRREKPAKLYSAKMLHMIDETLDEEGFQVLDYPDEYPEAVEITNFIAQHGFVESLKSEAVFREYKRIYNHHVLEKVCQVKTSVRTCTHPEMIADIDCVVPLPFILPQYEINLGEVNLGDSAEVFLQFYFHGDQLSAAVRTETFVPGITAKFSSSFGPENASEVVDFDLVQDAPVTSYQNRIEREKFQTVLIIKRCHSFDFTSARVHSRKVPSTSVERGKIIKHYNEAMSAKKKQERNPLVQSEIHQKKSNQAGSKIFELKIEFAPTSEYFDPEKEFDEMIYLDIHLGPQIPLHVKSKIAPARVVQDDT